nr:hypothetical protein [Wolbachia pipientis]
MLEFTSFRTTSNFKIIENTVEKACSCKTQHNGFSEKFSSILHF